MKIVILFCKSYPMKIIISLKVLKIFYVLQTKFIKNLKIIYVLQTKLYGTLEHKP